MDSAFLLKEKPARLLLALRSPETQNTVSGLARACSMSFVHASNLVAVFVSEGLVEVVRSGREKRVKLTENGVGVASALEALMAKLNVKKEESPQAPPQAEAQKEAPPQAPQVQPHELEFPEPPPQSKKDAGSENEEGEEKEERPEQDDGLEKESVDEKE
ncbi:Uncharacterised protein [Candidatus Burarchaeum australiense]|nr:Uncharacterised protein [Candidatus Burarchaeum australiense]